MQLRKVGLVIALVAAGCLDATREEPVSGNIGTTTSPADVVLTIGHEVRVDSLLRVGFMSVAADSRCPTTVVCVWSGDGAAEIAYGIGEGPSYPDTLHTTLEPRSVRFDGYAITLLDLMPYPYSPGTIPPDEYVIRLRVERLQR